MSQLSILCYLMQWREKADQTRVSVSVTCYLLCQRQVIRDLECKYYERERMMGGSTRVKGTTWSPGGRWRPWCTPTMCSTYSLELVKWSVRVWLLTVLVSVQSTSPFPTSSMSAHGEECLNALKKRPAFPLYSTSSSFSSQNKRGKSYKKDRTTLPWEMFSSFCNQCDHQASTQGNLKIRIQSVHEKIRHSCNQCDYQAFKNGDLKTHIQSVHEKIKYFCN